MSNYKIIMTGGGTAGHVTPNLALVPKLKEKGFDIKYIGSYEGIEKEIIVDAGIPYFAISSGKLKESQQKLIVSSLIYTIPEDVNNRFFSPVLVV